MYPPSRPQSIGEVLDAAFRIFRATLLRCLPYGVLAMVAGQLPNIYYVVTGRPPGQFGRGDPVWWGLYAIGAFFAIAFFNVIVIRQAAVASGSRPVARTELLVGLRKAPATAAVFLLLLLAIAVCFLPLLGVPREYYLWAILALSVPATYVGVLLSCSVVALLIGGKGIVASMRYSSHLILGSWWRTATIYSVAIAMLAVFYTLAGVIAAVLVPFAGVGDIAVITAVSAVMAAALGAVGVPFYTSMGLVLYGDLEARKEGADLERRIVDAAAG
ncbi:MAG: hypothetical protein ACREVV_22050 [Steroidobacteraceae bacterium]